MTGSAVSGTLLVRSVNNYGTVWTGRVARIRHVINAQKLVTETNNLGDLGLGGLITLKLTLKRRL
jgi:hypothetical protein